MDEKTKPAGVNGGHRALLVITNWKAEKKNTLRDFFSILPSGLRVDNCAVHQKQDSRWIVLPPRRYSQKDGSTGYSPLIEFAIDDVGRRFQGAGIVALGENT